MNPLKKLGDFLFGKSPDIFDENGRVLHKFSRKTWDDWRARFEHNNEYNWRKHVGVEGRQPKNSGK